MYGARAVQESIVKDFPDADISISIVWIQMPGFNDNETTARRIAGTIEDKRVKHFYDSFPAHFAGKAFAKGLIKHGPAWDIYFFYREGQEWTDGPPQPSEWMHQLGGGGRADESKFHAGTDLVEQLHETMHKVTAAECKLE